MQIYQNTSAKISQNSRYILILAVILLINGSVLASQLNIVGPAGSGTFGSLVATLPNGNIVVTDPTYDAGAVADVGAAYLYNGKTGELISTLTGSTANDQVGSGTNSITVLSNGNYVIRSTNWDNGAVTNVGAITFCNGTTGCSGVVSASNSLIGTTAADNIGSGGIVDLENGNYVLRTPNWDNGAVANVGAVTFCSATTGCVGAVSPTNSLVGTTAADTIGSSGFTVLPNKNYIVNSSSTWDNGVATNAGAITFCSGTTGCVGAVSPTNSLVGSTLNDNVGTITVLANNNFIVNTSSWDNGAVANVGAATFCSGTTGCVGAVSPTNSLIGPTAGDGGSGTSIAPLPNGNYVFRMPGWDNGTTVDAGATTFCNGTTGCPSGTVTAANSLVGTSAGDGTGIIINILTNGNYVVTASSWDNGATTNVGAATWCSATAGCSGAISPANSLIGSTSGDAVGTILTTLTNGNYVVRSTLWDNGATADVGAVTWCNGATGRTGLVTTANSLVGSTAADNVGTAVALTNGNYVVRSPNWDNGAVTNAGAVTWGDGVGGTTVGAVSPANSVVGSTAVDQVGTNAVALPNGNYVITNNTWDNGAVVDAGAVTWGNGSGGTVGVISAANSLVGTSTTDQVGAQGVLVVGNNYVARSTLWDNGAAANAGAVTWCNGNTGCVGAVSAANSLVGTTANDGVGAVTVLTNGNYVVNSNQWNNGATTTAGAVTWCNGNTGCSGAVSPANSLVGSTIADQIGSAAMTALPNGNYLVRSTNYDNGTVTQAGAFSYGAGNGGTVGVVSDENSVIGTVANGAGVTVASLDTFNETLVVGRPGSNTVTILNPTYNAASNGNWSADSTWNYGALTAMHDVYIPNGRTVNLDVVRMVNSLRIDCTGVVSGAGATGYIIGNVRKDFCAAGSFSFPVGTQNGFSPVDTNITALGTNPSSLTVSATQSAHPSLQPAISLKRFWTLTETGDLTANLDFRYLNGDVTAAESTYKLYRVSGGTPTEVTPFTLNANSNVISTTGVTNFSDWAVGNLSPLVADGTIDISYGSGGIRTIDFDGNPTPGQNDSDFGLDVTAQSDGKVIVVGESFVTTTDSAFSAVRLNNDGSVDTTFGTNGRFLFNVSSGVAERAYGAAVQPDGKIIIAGRTNSPRERVVMRLNANGTFDNTFGTNGVFRTPIGNPTFDEEEIAIQTDGKIIVTGATRNGGLTVDAFSVMRLNTNGSLDTTFDGDGEAVTVFNVDDRAYGVALQADGKIVVSGSSNNNGAMALARYNTDGSLDTTFDGDGKVTTVFTGATSLAYNLTIQPDGKIVTGGYVRTAQADGAVLRYNPNGSLDTSFSGDGIATFGTTGNELFWDVHVRHGKIVATGFRALVDPSSVEDFMIVRFDRNGVLDNSFGTSGVVYTDINITRDNCLSSTFTSDGKLVLAGYSSPVNPFNPDFAVIRYNYSSLKTPADFDGDGKSDLSIYRPVSGGTSQWWLQFSSSNTLQNVTWGLSSDVPTPADFDGDGKTDVAIWRPAPATQAAFYILNSSNNTLRIETFGQSGDHPAVVNDYDGDGRVDPAVYRPGTPGVFYYRGSLNNPNRNTTFIPWGTTGDKPVSGDFNGDGKADFAVFRNGNWWILPNGSTVHQIRSWGLATDKLVPADYDGDGKTDVAVFRPTEGVWYIQNSSSNSISYRNWGISSDVPIPGDYDGDSKTEVSIYRSGAWYISQSSNSNLRIENLGIVSDTPVPSISVVP